MTARTPEEMLMAATDNSQVARAATLVRYHDADEQLRTEHEASEKLLHDLAATGRPPAATDSRKGLEQGRGRGLAEDVASVAHRLLDTGMAVEQVATATGLSPAEVTRLAHTDED